MRTANPPDRRGNLQVAGRAAQAFDAPHPYGQGTAEAPGVELVLCGTLRASSGAGKLEHHLPAPSSSHERLQYRNNGFPLVIHADDFGETVGITNGIRQGIEAGALTSTSIIANMPATTYALQRVAPLADRASFGVHLNLCEGRPLTAAATLVDESGEFLRKQKVIHRALSGKLALAELEKEVAAQIALVRDAGVAISHVDGHKHLHQLPIVSTAVANVLPRFGIGRVRLTRLKSFAALGKRGTLLRELAAWRAARIFRGAGLHSPVRTVDLGEILNKGFGRRGPSALVDARGAVELCCHPAVPAPQDKPSSHRRWAELEYLLSSAFRELLQQVSARPVSYWEVG
jgi:chitin disaccharide deacetylase